MPDDNDIVEHDDESLDDLIEKDLKDDKDEDDDGVLPPDDDEEEELADDPEYD